MKKIETLRPFSRFIMTIGELPSSYLVSMTYEEQLIWLCNYLQNTVIPTVNNNGEAVEELQNLYLQLKEYVENYFENLDVQEEINNKLDEMAESGELADIISQFLTLGVLFTFNTASDLGEAENLFDGSSCYILGKDLYNDGKGAFYKVRQLRITDVIDGDNIIAITHSENLVAEKLPNYYITQIYNDLAQLEEDVQIIYSDITELKNATNLENGKKVKTLGYHSINDDGGAFYLIRTREEEEDIDEGSIVEIDENLVAELIHGDYINVKQFGAYGDGENSDSTAIQNAVYYYTKNYYQEGIGVKSNPTIFFPYGKYLIDTAIDLGDSYSLSIKGQRSILITESQANNCFNFGDYTGHPMYIEGLVFENFDVAININALNIDRSRSEISKCEFNYCNTAIYNNNTSSMLKVDECTFKACDKILNNVTADNVTFTSCWFSDKVYSSNESVSIVLNSGTLMFEKCFFIPAGANQTASKLAWIEMTSSEGNKKVYINNCRVSAESGYKTLINYKVDSRESNEPGKYTISITNCPIIAAVPIIRLFKLCCNINIVHNNFNSIGNKIIELDPSLTINDGSYAGLTNGFMYDNRIIIKDNYAKNNGDYDGYPGELVDITEADFSLYKSGSTIPFYVGQAEESAITITLRQAYLVTGRYWYSGVGASGIRQFIGLVHLYTSNGYLYTKYENLSNDNANLSITTSLSGTEYSGGSQTASYTDVNNIYLKGASYYLNTTINIKANYSVDATLKRI